MQRRAFRLVPALLLLSALAAAGQTPVPAPAAPAAVNPGRMGALREQLIDSLRMTPALENAVASDPTLLADQAYLNRSNPDLARWVEQHPEVARNPDFYLFADLGPGEPRLSRQRRLGPAEAAPYQPTPWNDIAPVLVFGIFAVFAAWLIRAVLEHKRWGRVATVRTDAHNRLLEKFGSSQDLLTYMQSEAGREFLESASLREAMSSGTQTRGLLARLLAGLQFGIVFTLVGAVLAGLRNNIEGAHDPLLILGLLSLAVGVGLIAAAAVSYSLSRHFGLLERPAQ